MTKGYIYGLLDPESMELRYVGQTWCLSERYYKHVWEAKNLKTNHKRNWIKSLLSRNLEPKLQIIEVCELDRLDERECFHIAQYRAAGCRLTNLTDGGGGLRGFKMPEEVKEKISRAIRGENHPFFGKKHSAEHVINMAKAATGKTLSKEGREKVSRFFKGRKQTPEHRLKISLAQQGSNNSFFGKSHTPEAKQKMSAFHTGRIKTEETRKKLSKALKGQPKSPETRKKLSEARKRYLERKQGKNSAD